MSPARPAWLGALIVVVAAALFGSLGVSSRFAYDQGMEPFAFVAWRATVGAIGLLLVVLVMRRRDVAAEPGSPSRVMPAGRAAYRWLALAVVLGTALNLAAFLSFDNTTVALALLGFYTYPAMVAGASVLLGREPLDGWRIAALLLAMVGMAAVVLGGPAAEPTGRATLFGMALALAAAVFQTAFVLTTRGYAGVPAERAMGTILAGSATLAIALTAVTSGPAALALPLTSPSLLALLVFVGLFAAALPSVLFLTGIRWIGGVRTGILMLFEPVVGVGLAALLLGETLSLVQGAGGATILLAALLVQRASHGSHRVDDPHETPTVAPAPGGP
jgi:drug/metabolite transporter (DMT)-like permease